MCKGDTHLHTFVLEKCELLGCLSGGLCELGWWIKNRFVFQYFPPPTEDCDGEPVPDREEEDPVGDMCFFFPKRLQTATFFSVNPKFRPVMVTTIACARKETTTIPTLGLSCRTIASQEQSQ